MKWNRHEVTNLARTPHLAAILASNSCSFFVDPVPIEQFLPIVASQFCISKSKKNKLKNIKFVIYTEYIVQ